MPPIPQSYEPAPQNPLGTIGFIGSLIAASVTLIALFLTVFSCGILGILLPLSGIVPLLSLLASTIALVWRPRGHAIAGILISVLSLIPNILIVLGFWVVVEAGSAFNEQQREKAEKARIQEEEYIAEQMVRIKSMETVYLAKDAMEPFQAINFVFMNKSDLQRHGSLCQFYIDGPDPAASLPSDPKIKQIAWDSKNERYFGITDHKFGSIGEEGSFVVIAIEDNFHHPIDLAYVPEEEQIYVVCRDAAFTYNDNTREWKRLENFRSGGLHALTYDPEEEVFWALFPKNTLSKEVVEYTLEKINKSGAIISSVSLSHPILKHNNNTPVQMAWSSGRLIILTPPAVEADSQKMALYLVETFTGKVTHLCEDELGSE